MGRGFIALVVAPTALAATYFGLLASPLYISESRFVVRAAESPDQNVGMANIFKGFAASNDSNLLFVRDFLLSRQVASDLDRELHLREQFHHGDPFMRFPGPFDRGTLESFYPYYESRVTVTVDPDSSVAVLRVKGFSPQFVAKLNEVLLQKAAARVDALNARIREDGLVQAEREKLRAEEELRRAERNIAAYRRDHEVMDPEQQAVLELQGRQELTGKLVAAEAQLAQLKRIAPQSSQIAALEAEVTTLGRSIAKLQATVSSPAASSRAQTSEQFRALAARRDIATKIVAAATEALIRARADAERHHLYLEIISAASRPDEALLPRRMRNVVATFLLSLVCWGAFNLLWAGVREHRAKL
jgi:capsular polysaccharide transport system permease protein